MAPVVSVLVDGDSCPVPVRDVLVRAARAGRVRLEVLANRELPGPAAEYTTRVFGRDVDSLIIEKLQLAGGNAASMLVVTRDIPLAERVLETGAAAINDRGTVFDADSIRERRSIRDAAEAIRVSGLESMSRNRRYGEREKRAFANALDRTLRMLAG